MDIVVGDLLTVDGKKYLTIEVLEYENNKYAFVSKLTDEDENTGEFYIFKAMYDGVRIIVEDNLKNILIPKFQELIQKDIKDLMQ